MFFLNGLILGSFSFLMAAGYPGDSKLYKGRVNIRRAERQSVLQLTQLRGEIQSACRSVDRAAYVLNHRLPAVTKSVGLKGANFPVLVRNQSFYRTRLRNRVDACVSGKLSFHLEKSCHTGRETLAFVRVTLGFVHRTIHLCPRFFELSSSERVGTLVHEYGRLEGIGDSPEFDTDNIYVWDANLRILNREEFASY